MAIEKKFPKFTYGHWIGAQMATDPAVAQVSIWDYRPGT
jgi:hypothetical protein